jgi:Rieske 2Fe-2S family protein
MAKDTTFQKRGADYKLAHDLQTLPSDYYQSEAIYKEELDKVFYKRWLLAARAEEIPNTGDFTTLQIGDENLIITRGEDGNIRALFNVCRHRGTRMCASDKGCFENKKIGCPYHAWSYDLTGKLNAAPIMDKTPGFDKSKHALFEAAVHIWEGFVFINLAEDPMPFEKDKGALIGRFGDWGIGDLRIAHTIRYELNCNWKLVLHNYQECYHCPGVHPRLAKLTPFQGAAHDCMDGSVIGGYMTLGDKVDGMTMDGKAAGKPLGKVSGDDLRRIYYYSVFPNALLTPHPDFVMFHRVTPLGVGRTRLDCHWLSSPETIANPAERKRLDSAIEFWDITNREDWTVCEQMQQGTKSRRFDRGVYAASEDVLAQLDKEFLRALGHKTP